MIDYGEACPISKATSVLGERWTLQIIREMMLGASRFSEFQRYMPKISPSLLNTRLQSLEQAGVIYRKRIAEQKGYEYLLSPSGKALKPLMMELGKWGMCFAFDELEDEEMNAFAILRDIAVGLDLDQLPAGDCVFQFSLNDVPETPNLYIIIKEKPATAAHAEVCDENPGHEVDVYFHSTIRCLTEIWFGKTSLAAARRRGEIKVTGPSIYTKHINKWFPVSTFAGATIET